MRLRLNDIEAFMLVVEIGSISGAALRLSIAKSVVSKRITDLEKELGAQLLHRSRRGVSTTDRGQAFYHRVRDITRELEDAADATSDDGAQLCGQLKLAVPASFGTMYLAPMLFDFASQHPGLNVMADFDDRKVDIEAGGFDLAIRVTQLKDTALVAKPLASSRRMVCCSPAYAVQHGLPQTIDELHRHRCISYAYVHSGQLWQFESRRSDEQVRSIALKTSHVFNNGEAMRDAAVAGLGLCLIPVFIAAPALRQGKLIDAMPREQPTADAVYALYPFRRMQPRKVRLFIEFLQQRLAGVPPWERDLGR